MMKIELLKKYENIINHENFIVTMDCDSTVIWSKKWNNWEILTTWEWLTDAAFSLEKRLKKANISKEIDEIAQITMSKQWAIFEDSLNSRLSIFIKYWLTKEDILNWAKEAILEEWFYDYIQLKNWLKKENKIDYEQFFFLSGWFREMLETVLEKAISKNVCKKIIYSNEFKYRPDWLVIWWDKEKSLMYSQTAKKDMVEKLRKEWKILNNMKVSGLWDGSNDISMSDEWLFVAYTWVKRREKVVEKALWVEAINFYEVSVFHTSPEERRIILKKAPKEIKDILLKWIESLEKRLEWIKIIK